MKATKYLCKVGLALSQNTIWILTPPFNEIKEMEKRMGNVLEIRPLLALYPPPGKKTYYYMYNKNQYHIHRKENFRQKS